MKRKSLILIIIAGVILWLGAKYRALRSLEISPGLPRSFRLNGGTLEFILPLNAFNVSNENLNVGGVDLFIYAENQRIGRAYLLTPAAIRGTGLTEIPAQCRTSLFDLASAIPGFVAGAADRSITMRFEGLINIEGLFVPVNETYTFNIPKLS